MLSATFSVIVIEVGSRKSEAGRCSEKKTSDFGLQTSDILVKA